MKTFYIHDSDEGRYRCSISEEFVSLLHDLNTVKAIGETIKDGGFCCSDDCTINIDVRLDEHGAYNLTLRADCHPATKENVENINIDNLASPPKKKLSLSPSSAGTNNNCDDVCSEMFQLSPFKQPKPRKNNLSRKSLQFACDKDISYADPPNTYENEVFASSGPSDACAADWNVEDNYPTVFVEIFNIPKGFIKEHLVRYIHRQLYDRNFLQKNVVGVKSCSDMVDGENSVIVELTSPTLVDNLCSIPDELIYEDERILFVKHYNGGNSTMTAHNEEATFADDRTTLFIEVYNLPEDVIKEHLMRFINRKIEAKFSSVGAVKCCTEINETNNGVILELTSSNMVNNLLSLFPLVYEDRVLYANKHFVDPKDVGTSVATTGNHDIGAVKSATDPASPLGNLLFIRTLVKLNTAFDGKNHASAYARLQNDLADLGVSARVPDLMRKRRNLLDQYSRRKHRNDTTWQFYLPCAVLAGDLPLSVLSDTQFDPNRMMTSRSEAADGQLCYRDVAFPNPAVWPLYACQRLIEEFRNVKDLFDSPTRHSKLWFTIGEALYTHYGLVYSPEQCEHKIGELKKRYKDCQDGLTRTGSVGANVQISWPLFKEMAQVMEGDVSVTPAITVSVGQSNQMWQKNVQSAGHTGTSSLQRFGKGRPSSSKRSNLSENTEKSLAQIAAAMEKRNELLLMSENKDRRTI